MDRENKVFNLNKISIKQILNPKELEKKIENEEIEPEISKSTFVSSFLLNFFLIFLVPILNTISIFAQMGGLPKIECWLSAAVSFTVSGLLFFSIDDIYAPDDYTEEEILLTSDTYQYLNGINPLGIFAFILDLAFIIYITLKCWPSIQLLSEYLRSQSRKDKINGDLIVVYAIKITGIILLLSALHNVAAIRALISRRKTYLIKKKKKLQQIQSEIENKIRNKNLRLTDKPEIFH